jgi:hypothetical protein
LWKDARQIWCKSGNLNKRPISGDLWENTPRWIANKVLKDVLVGGNPDILTNRQAGELKLILSEVKTGYAYDTS